ncbi:MAG: HAD family hydrolase [Butyricicoccus pullicaecorum]
MLETFTESGKAKRRVVVKIQAVFFDIGGTIHVQDATPEQDVRYANLVHELLEEHGIEAGTAHDLLQKIDCGAKKYKKYVEEHLVELQGEQIWTDLCCQVYRDSTISEQLSFLFDRYRKQITPRKGLHEMLETLRAQGYQLGVISNIMSRTFVPRILEEYGITYFQTLTLSSECGIRKPRREIFDLALEEAGVEAGGLLCRGYDFARCARCPMG